MKKFNYLKLALISCGFLAIVSCEKSEITPNTNEEIGALSSKNVTANSSILDVPAFPPKLTLSSGDRFLGEVTFTSKLVNNEIIVEATCPSFNEEDFNSNFSFRGFTTFLDRRLGTFLSTIRINGDRFTRTRRQFFGAPVIGDLDIKGTFIDDFLSDVDNGDGTTTMRFKITEVKDLSNNPITIKRYTVPATYSFIRFGSGGGVSSGGGSVRLVTEVIRFRSKRRRRSN